MAAKPPVALTIAGVDSSGGAGVIADLRTFDAHGVWGTAAVTAATAQNTLGVQTSEAVSPEVVRSQIASVASDVGVQAAKTGMLVNAYIARVVAETIGQLGIRPLVIDPVFVSTHGDTMLDLDGIDVMREELLPMATVVTPNIAEAAVLAGQAVDGRETMEQAAAIIAAQGPPVVMITGGHLATEDSPDCLLSEGRITWLEGPRISAPHNHGSGCVLSAAIAAGIAKGMEPGDACVAAKAFTHRALAAGIRLGSGIGPVDPGWERR
jgi:hydroxymethylpyrimidine/phosphomethylpyrimidine kinase